MSGTLTYALNRCSGVVIIPLVRSDVPVVASQGFTFFYGDMHNSTTGDHGGEGLEDVGAVVEELSRTHPEVVMAARRQFEDYIRRFYTQTARENERPQQQERSCLPSGSSARDAFHGDSGMDALNANADVVRESWRRRLPRSGIADRFHEEYRYRGTAFCETQGSCDVVGDATTRDCFCGQEQMAATCCSTHVTDCFRDGDATRAVSSVFPQPSNLYDVRDTVLDYFRGLQPADPVHSLATTYPEAATCGVQSAATISFGSERRLTPAQVARAKELLEELLRTLSTTPSETTTASSMPWNLEESGSTNLLSPQGYADDTSCIDVAQRPLTSNVAPLLTEDGFGHDRPTGSAIMNRSQRVTDDRSSLGNRQQQRSSTDRRSQRPSHYPAAATISFGSERRLTPAQVARAKELLEELLRTLSTTPSETTTASSMPWNLEESGSTNLLSPQGYADDTSCIDVAQRPLTSNVAPLLTEDGFGHDRPTGSAIMNRSQRVTDDRSSLGNRQQQRSSTDRRSQRPSHYPGKSGSGRNKVESSRRSLDQMNGHRHSRRETASPRTDEKRRWEGNRIVSSIGRSGENGHRAVPRISRNSSQSVICRVCKHSGHTSSRCLYVRHRK
ncbi:hypothetical protein Tcan_03005 [Toxocara canis]|uniref:Uncharacterized protein n=1 Tax=Toxocara canis TaxID=6265 RepID=A0A0B2V3T4_TOXCA|nr:hypothetical protein Tcan_03005 [Toxocara canis]